MSIDTATEPRAATRDGFLDVIRSVSISRVIAIHIIGQAKFWFWPAPTWIAPGMPMVFFVSGGLALQSLREKEGRRRSAVEYWKKTYRRLLLPYWTYYAVVASFAVVGDLTHETDYWNVNYWRLMVGATGLVIPDASNPIRHHMGHVWFMAVFLVLAFLAPGLVRLFEKAKWAPLTLALVAFVWVQYLVLEDGAVFEYEIEKVTAFAIPYLVGFFYTDGALRRAPAKALLATAAVLAAGAWYWNGIEPGSVNGSQTKHLLVGGFWMCLALAAAPLLQRASVRFAGVIDRVNRRSFTAYLWGWTTCVFASDWVDEYIAPGWGNRLVTAVVALTFLAVVVTIFGRVEDYSARRPTKRRQLAAA